ncbi:MAG TPA: hypothetical protein VJ808_12325 [Gemmatimonadales bacterium]|nr:hypothetical protein [Gemmatimonadales bacterium]
MTVARQLQAIAAMIGVFALTSPMTVEAQDTSSTRDTLTGEQARSDSAVVQNPPGYRGMERDTTIFPPQDDSVASGDATSRTSQEARQDSLEGAEGQNPPGYRGMERPAGLDSAQMDSTQSDTGLKKHDKAKTKKSSLKKKAKQHPDSSAAGRAEGETVQNPPGYRGMERDTTIVPPQDDTSGADDATDRTSQRARQDSLDSEGSQNPPGYRGMERPSALDSAGAQEGDTGSTQAQ